MHDCVLLGTWQDERRFKFFTDHRQPNIDKSVVLLGSVFAFTSHRFNQQEHISKVARGTVLKRLKSQNIVDMGARPGIMNECVLVV